MTRTEGSGIIEVERSGVEPPASGPMQSAPIWIKYQQFVSARGVVIEGRGDDTDFEGAWRQLARKARSRFAQDNPY